MRFTETSTLFFASLMLLIVAGQGQSPNPSPSYTSIDPCQNTTITRCELEDLRFLQMRFLGSDCSQNKTEQSPLQFQCEDYGTISFEEDIYMEVKGASNDSSIYYSNAIEEYQIVELYDDGPVMSSDINITIYNTSVSPENILQTMKLSSDCDDGTRIFLGDIYGSLQLVGFSNGDKLIQCDNYETPSPSIMQTTQEPSIKPTILTPSPTLKPSMMPIILTASPTKEPSLVPIPQDGDDDDDAPKPGDDELCHDGKKGGNKNCKKTLPEGDDDDDDVDDECSGDKKGSKKGCKKQGKKMDKKADKKKKELHKGDDDDDDDNSRPTLSPTTPSKKSRTLSPTIVPQYGDDDDDDVDCTNTKKGCKKLKKRMVEKGYKVQEELRSE